MAAADIQAPPALPDYVTDPDAVLKDTNVKWRYGRAPDYSKTRQVFAASKYTIPANNNVPTFVAHPYGQEYGTISGGLGNMLAVPYSGKVMFASRGVSTVDGNDIYSGKMMKFASNSGDLNSHMSLIDN
ncbi:hypothetical protein DPSP01_003454 [Paraphaeosphaeria sporulosa]